MSSKTRVIWLDWARAFAILAVIICHSTEAIYPFTIDAMASASNTSRLAALSYFSFGRLGVPFFLFMTGYLLLDREYNRTACVHFWKTKWFGLLLATEIWIVIYMTCS